MLPLLNAFHVIQELGLLFGLPGGLAGIAGWFLLGSEIRTGGKNLFDQDPWEPAVAALVTGVPVGLLLGGGLAALNGG